MRLVAKGARSKRSNLKARFSRLLPYCFAFGGRGEVKTLRTRSRLAGAPSQRHHSLHAAFTSTSFLSRVLEHETRFFRTLLRLFALVSSLLLAQAVSPEPALNGVLNWRCWGIWIWRDFLHCAGSGEAVDDAMTYLYYREEKGFIATWLLIHNTFTGHHLRLWRAVDFRTANALRAAKRFHTVSPEALLGGKPLKVASFFRQFLPARAARADKTNNDYEDCHG